MINEFAQKLGRLQSRIENGSIKTETDLFEAVAKTILLIDTLETRRSDSLDFHEVAVWGLKDALEAAYLAGKHGILPK